MVIEKLLRLFLRNKNKILHDALTDQRISDAVKQCNRFLDYLIELNIILLIFAFPLIHVWNRFNDFWKSLIIIWVLKKLINININKIKISIPPTCIYLFALVGTIILSSIFSEQLHLSLNKIRYFILGITLSIVVYDFLNHSEMRIHRVISYFIISAVLTAIYPVVHQVIITKGTFGISLSGLRATGFFCNTFYLALWSGIGLFLVIFRFIEASTKTSQFVCSICILILGLAFLFSKTRAPWIAMTIIFGTTFVCVPYKKNLLKAILSLIAITMILFVIDNAIRAKTISIINTSNERWIIWEQTLTIIKENFTQLDWFFGRGPGIFKLEYSHLIESWEVSVLPRVYAFPHMIPLELFYASGILGVLAFILWLANYLFKLLPLLKNNSSNLYVNIGLMPFLILFTCLINEQFFSRYFSFTFWFFAGASFSLLHMAEN